MNTQIVISCLIILNLLLTFCLAVSKNGEQSDDPSVPDDSDMNIIDDWINSEKIKNKDQSPDRGSLQPSTPIPHGTGNSPSIGDQVRKNEKGDICQCVKYYLCGMKKEEATNTIKTPQSPEGPGTTEESNAGTEGTQNILGVVDIRNGVGANNQTCPGGDFDVCCPLNDIKAEATSTMTTTTSVSIVIPPPPSPNPPPPYSGRHHCGHRNENGLDSKIAAAPQQAQFGEFPWTVAIIHLEKNEDNFTVLKYIGAGSLLHPQVVLTVAHNVLGKSRLNLKVRLGEWDTQTNDEPYPSQDRGVKKVIVHELFLKKTMYNDVALLILDEEARFAPNVDTVCLPPLPKKGQNPFNFDGQVCYLASWGKDQLGLEGRYSDIMKKVSVPVVAHDACEKELQKSEKLPAFRLDKSFMCAGGGESGQDACKGDGGSPLVCSIVGGESGHEDGIVHYVQVGAVSWGLGCKSDTFPGVYSNIQRLTPWILSTMEKEEMSTEYCTFH